MASYDLAYKNLNSNMTYYDVIRVNEKRFAKDLINIFRDGKV